MDFKEKYLSHDIINEMIGLIAHCVLRDSLAKIQVAEYFALIGDETRDISSTEQLAVSTGPGEPLRQPRLWPGQYLAGLQPMLASWLSFSLNILILISIACSVTNQEKQY